MRIENSLTVTHPLWKESHYYPIIDLSISQYVVERVNIEDDGFIIDLLGSGNELEQELIPNTQGDVQHKPIEVHFSVDIIKY